MVDDVGGGGRDAEGSVDPRIARSRRVIREAALAELGETGYGGFSIEGVAERAGVGKSTIYRHWSGKLGLIEDALETLNVQPAPRPGSGDARAQVALILRHLAGALRDSRFSAIVPALVAAAEHEPKLRDFHHRYASRRRRTLTNAIARGVEAGELSPDLDPELASIALAGAIFYRRLLTPRPLAPGEVGALMDTVLGRAAG